MIRTKPSTPGFRANFDKIFAPKCAGCGKQELDMVKCTICRQLFCEYCDEGRICRKCSEEVDHGM